MGRRAANSAASADQNISARLQRSFGAGVNYTYGPAQVGFVWTHAQIDGMPVEPVRFVVGLRRVGLFHQVGGLFDVVFLLSFDLLDLLPD